MAQMPSDVRTAANKVRNYHLLFPPNFTKFPIFGHQKAALEQLRFNKNKQAAQQNATSAALQFPSANQPPAQSRDGTITSKFFPATPPSPGNVLVPNSSPLGQENLQLSYEPYGYRRMHDVAPLANGAHASAWSPNLAFMAADTLSAPSGLIPARPASFHAPTRRQWSSSEGPHDANKEEGPPRKRLNRGPPNDATPFSPPLPNESHRPSPRPRTVSDTISISSEDSLPDLSRLASSSNSRIIHKHSSSTDIPADPFSDPEFIKLNMTMPGESVTRIRAAWKQSGYNFQRATALMANPSWSPSASSPEKSEKEDIGRVKEVEEAFRAQKIAVKEKGKKSMIYANRLALETKSQSTPKNDGIQVIDMIQTPNTPVIAPRRKRLKTLVIDSDSEAEVEDDENSEDGRKHERIESNDEIRALNYLNTTSREGIQELTGMFLSIELFPRSNLTPFEGCTSKQADTVISLRPFESVDDLNVKLGQGKKKAGPAGISPRLFEDCTEIFKGYGAVDSILEECESIGAHLRSTIASWSLPYDKGKERADPSAGFSDEFQDGSISLRSLSSLRPQKVKDHLTEQPSILSADVRLKEYQLLGVNWLNLLYRNSLSCILADEMGM